MKKGKDLYFREASLCMSEVVQESYEYAWPSAPQKQNPTNTKELPDSVVLTQYRPDLPVRKIQKSLAVNLCTISRSFERKLASLLLPIMFQYKVRFFRIMK